MMNLACSRVRIRFFRKATQSFSIASLIGIGAENRRFDIVDVRRPLAIGANLAVVDQVLERGIPSTQSPGWR